MKRIEKIAFVAASVIAAATFSGCDKNKSAGGETASEAEQTFVVGTMITKAGNFDDYLEFGGDIASVNSVYVMPDQAGKVTNVLVSVGDIVSKGQTIAYVNPLRAGAVYNDSPVKSPISGRITSLPVTIGSTVSQSSSIANVARTDDLEVRINIAERFVSRISDKQKATITFDAYPNVEFPATVFEISPVLDTSSRTMSVKLHFDNKDPRIKVGMYGRVKLVTDSVKDAIVVPSNAVVVREQKNYLFVVQPHSDEMSTVKLVPIAAGISVDNKTEISDGVKAGDEIVIKGMSLLNDGSKVKIVSTSKADSE